MADSAPKAQRVRQRRRRRNNGAAPTADDTPSGTNNHLVSRRRRRFPRRRRARPGLLTQNPVVTTRRYIHREVKRELKREGLEGPKVSVQQRITSTFGLIGPNTSGNAELELNFFTHPSLAKEANDGTAFGPLQALAAQYALWKIKYLTLRFTPMVGASAVSGTVVRASLNLSQSPGGSNWSGLGTRVHIDMHPGQTQVFHLRGDQVGGPRDGGWWFTDTNEEGSQSAGPIVEVHTLGKTLSTFKDQPWEGPLFLVEGIGLWQFANYQVKPALGSLERREAEVNATIKADAGQPIMMELPSSSEVAFFMDALEPEVLPPGARASAERVGETIFQIVDIGAQLASAALPPPFSWLIKGGWWFVKKLLGRTRDGASSFVVYASLSDAQNNKPAIASDSVTGSKVTKMLVTQINSPNVGPNPMIPSTRMGPQTLTPGSSFRLHSQMISELFVTMTKTSSSTTINVPVSTIPGVLRNASGAAVASNGSWVYIQTPWWVGVPGRAPNSSSVLPSQNAGGYVHSLYRLIDPHFTDQSGDHEYYPPDPVSGVNFCILSGFNINGDITSTAKYAVYGKVVATSLIQAGTTPPVSMVFTLIKTITDYRLDNDKTKDMLMVIADNVGEASINVVPYSKSASAENNWPILERAVPTGTYLLAVSYTNDPKKVNNVDIPTTLMKGPFPRTESTLASIFPYALAGQLFAATSVDLNLIYAASPDVSDALVDQLRLLQVPFELPVSTSDPSPEPRISDISDSSDQDDDDESGYTSEDEFWGTIGGEFMSIPSRWEHLFENGRLKPEYSK